MSNLSVFRNPASLLSLAATMGLALTAGQVMAATVPDMDLATVQAETLTQVATTMTVELQQSFPLGNQGAVVGTLVNAVYQDTGTGDADYGHYVYEETLTPAASAYTPPVVDPFRGMASFIADFNAQGFTGEAGYNFLGVPGLGGTVSPSGAFYIATDPLVNSITWNSLDPKLAWAGGTPLTMFFESTDAPSPTLGAYEALALPYVRRLLIATSPKLRAVSWLHFHKRLPWAWLAWRLWPASVCCVIVVWPADRLEQSLTDRQS